MGCCASVEDGVGKLRNDQIEEQLRMEKLKMENQVKLLLLGSGESGKSTIIKQMKLIHSGGFEEDERLAYREIIYSNTVQSMVVTLEAMEKLGIALADPDNQPHVATILQQNVEDLERLPAPVAQAVKSLWADEGVRETFRRRNEFQLNDSADYYFESIDRIAAPDYIPTDQDVLRSRVKSTGITETKFVINGLTYKMFDVGGQRSERKKWIHCFENVTAVIFMVSISEYDQLLFEDETVNRMDEAMTLFDSVCNSRWFAKTPIILFLNKTDLFREKLKTSPLSKHFPDYMGGSDFDAATEYLKQRFLSLLSNDKPVYSHLTCATDTEQVKFVMNAVNDIVLQINLGKLGLL